MSTIAWAETLPSDGSAVGRSPREIQSLWTSIGAGLNGDGPVHWPPTTSIASIGECKPGMFRIYVGAKSLSSNDGSADTQARVYFASDASQLYTYLSNGTYRIGTRGLLEYQAEPGGANTGVVAQTGTVTHAASGSEAITFPTAYALVSPYVQLTASSGSFLAGVTNLTVSGCTSTVSYLGPGADPGTTVTWSSIGTISGAI